MNNRNNTDDDEQDVELNDEQDIFMNVQPVANIIEYRFYDDIMEPEKYIPLIRRLGNASPNDVVHLHFVCDGGRMDAMQAIINAIRRTPANVIGFLDSHTASAASMIYLSCDAWSFNKESYMMFHDFNGGLFGKGHEMNSQLTHYVDNFKVIMDELCFPFFSKQEISQICNGQDRWLNSDEIGKRLKVLNEYREKMKQKVKRNRTAGK